MKVHNVLKILVRDLLSKFGKSFFNLLCSDGPVMIHVKTIEKLIDFLGGKQFLNINNSRHKFCIIDLFVIVMVQFAKYASNFLVSGLWFTLFLINLYVNIFHFLFTNHTIVILVKIFELCPQFFDLRIIKLPYHNWDKFSFQKRLGSEIP